MRRVMQGEALHGVLLLQCGARAVEKPVLEERVEKHLPSRLVGRVPARARLYGGDRRPLRREDRAVEALLRAREAARSRKRARHVGGVSLHVTARVDEDEVARADPPPALRVVKDRGVLAGSDDRGVRRPARSHRAKAAVDRRLELVFEEAGLHEAARLAVRGCRDGRGPLHERDLLRPLHEAHRVEKIRRVLHGHRPAFRVPGVAPEAPEKPRDDAVAVGVAAERVMENARPPHEIGQALRQLGDRVRVVRAVVAHGALGTGPSALPRFLRAVPRPHEQGEGHPVRVEHGDRLGLGETGQIEEIRIGAVPVAHVVAGRRLWRREEQRSAFAHLVEEARPAPREDRGTAHGEESTREEVRSFGAPPSVRATMEE